MDRARRRQGAGKAQPRAGQRWARPASDLSLGFKLLKPYIDVADTVRERSITNVIAMPTGLSVQPEMVDVHDGRREWREN